MLDRELASHRGISGLIRYSESVTEGAETNRDFGAHIHTDELEIYHFLDGDLFFVFEGRRIEISSGTVIIICNNTHHRPIISSTCRYSRKHVYLHRRAFSKFDTPDLELYKRICERKLIVISRRKVDEMKLTEFFDEIKDSLSQNTAYGELCAVIRAISMLISAERLCDDETVPIFRPYNEKIDAITRYIGDHLSEKLTYETISEQFYISPKSLYKFFKKETGTTLSKYILERRIIKAQSILSAGGTAGEAATLAGFDDYTVFYRCFQRELCMTPTEYKKRLGH